MNKKLKKSIYQAAKSIVNSLPMILSIILLIGIIDSFLLKDIIKMFFTNSFLDVIIGSVIGSISAGNPITSYIIGGELLKQGVSLFAITAFLVAWVTVGIVQLPAEIFLLGKRFAIIRNIVSFVFSIVVALITVVVVSVI
jgi:uncharacterized membrane protein YraQ (UPF0718 family)